jgi:hypothetical protein
VLSERVEQELIKDPSSELMEPSSEQSKEIGDGDGAEHSGWNATCKGDCGGVGSC